MTGQAMTAPDLERLRGLLDAYEAARHRYLHEIVPDVQSCQAISEAHYEADIALTQAARHALPALLAIAERAEKMREALEQTASRMTIEERCKADEEFFNKNGLEDGWDAPIDIARAALADGWTK